jgi:hypothetical protein
LPKDGWTDEHHHGFGNAFTLEKGLEKLRNREENRAFIHVSTEKTQCFQKKGVMNDSS